MGDMMTFPEDPKKFIKDYSFKDKEEIYTNGSELIPVFRVEQMLEHYFPVKRMTVREFKEFCCVSDIVLKDTVIEPCYLKKPVGVMNMDNPEEVRWLSWCNSVSKAEDAYITMLEHGATPQEARAVLPNSLKTEVVMTANLREWRHFFNLRACGATGKPHPQMLEVAVPLLKEIKSLIPVVFDDLEPLEE